MPYRYMWKKHDKFKHARYFNSSSLNKFDRDYTYVEYFLLANDSTLARFGLNDKFVLKISTTLFILWDYLYMFKDDPAILRNEKQIGPKSKLTEHLLNQTHEDISLEACGLSPKYSYTIYDSLTSIICGASSPASKIVNARSIENYQRGDGLEDGTFSSNITSSRDINYRIMQLLERAEGRPVVELYNEIVQTVNSNNDKSIKKLKMKRLKKLANAIEDELIIQIADMLQEEDAKTEILKDHIEEILSLDEYKVNYQRYDANFVF